MMDTCVLFHTLIWRAQTYADAVQAHMTVSGIDFPDDVQLDNSS